MANNWRYIGMMPVCSEEINPFTDAKNKNYSLTVWEGAGYVGGLGSSWVSYDSFSKITKTNVWIHYTIEKLNDNQIKQIITYDGNSYTGIMNVPNLQNLSKLHIGSRDNPSSRNTGGIISMKNIKVKLI